MNVLLRESLIMIFSLPSVSVFIVSIVTFVVVVISALLILVQWGRSY